VVIHYAVVLAMLLSAVAALVLTHFRSQKDAAPPDGRLDLAEPSVIDIDGLVDAGEIDVADTTTLTDMRMIEVPKAAPTDATSTWPGP
jgi:hypothetical protein